MPGMSIAKGNACVGGFFRTPGLATPVWGPPTIAMQLHHIDPGPNGTNGPLVNNGRRALLLDPTLTPNSRMGAVANGQSSNAFVITWANAIADDFCSFASLWDQLASPGGNFLDSFAFNGVIAGGVDFVIQIGQLTFTAPLA